MLLLDSRRASARVLPLERLATRVGGGGVIFVVFCKGCAVVAVDTGRLLMFNGAGRSCTIGGWVCCIVCCLNALEGGELRSDTNVF
jgi:hypothetical protein